MTPLDVNELPARALTLRASAHYQEALEIYLFLADGDPSLDEGWLAVQIAECYDLLQRPIEARFWAARAIEGNPALSDRHEILERLGRIRSEQLASEPGFHEARDSQATDEDGAESDRILRSIDGGEALFDWYGEYRPSFHDAEVLRLDLDRKGPTLLSLEVMYPRRAIVTFALEDWIDISLDGFSHQNVIGELIIRTASSSRAVELWERGVGLRPGQHEIELVPIFGVNGLIRATIKRVELRPSRQYSRGKR